MHDSEAPVNVGQKAAQLGYSVTVLNKSLYEIDVNKRSVLYLLPTKTPDATDFSANRFNPLIEESPLLQDLFSDVNQVGSKRAGSAVLYVRGSNSRASLKSIPVSLIVFDEFDEMNAKNIPLARERMSGQMQKEEWLISTPTIPGAGINIEYRTSTQEHFFFKCPCCSRRIELTLENLIVTASDILDPRLADSKIICLECKNDLPQGMAKGEYLQSGIWVPTAESPDPMRRGFYVNQLYSSTITPAELGKALLLADTNKAAEQEFYNSKMGLAHEVDGARVSEQILEPCFIPGYRKQEVSPPGRIITMGIDVGKRNHVEIDAWTLGSSSTDITSNAKCQLVWEGTVDGFAPLYDLMRQYQVHSAVIDIFPEKSEATRFARAFWGFVKLCFYAKGMTGKLLSEVGDEDEFKINADRTYWLDNSLGRFKNRTIGLPVDLSTEYRGHVRNIVRTYKEDKDGLQTGTYVTTDGEDHFAHARNYAEIALLFAVSKQYSRNISVLL